MGAECRLLRWRTYDWDYGDKITVILRWKDRHYGYGISQIGEASRMAAAVLTKYLRSMRFDVTNDIFATNSCHFRNSLVRANYNKLSKEIIGPSEHKEEPFRTV